MTAMCLAFCLVPAGAYAQAPNGAAVRRVPSEAAVRQASSESAVRRAPSEAAVRQAPSESAVRQVPSAGVAPPAQATVPLAVLQGRKALAAKDFVAARDLFRAYLNTHPRQLAAELGLADAELGLHEYQAAELRYRSIVAAEPTLWAAHENLVIVEAALGRWEEFDRERAFLHQARQANLHGLSRRDSDVIEALAIEGKSGPQRWIARDYFEPAGRTGERYTFERFSPAGRVLAVVSLENEGALDALANHDNAVAIGTASVPGDASAPLVLDWVSGSAHGILAHYAHEPTYEQLRLALIRWARTQP